MNSSEKRPAGLSIEKAIAAGKAVWTNCGGLPYGRFVHDFEEIVRGTAVFASGTVYGYPSIGRLLALDAALPRQFGGPFWAEEKIDGFNVRVCRVQGRNIALTRGGFVCPFTTDRLADLLDPAIFDDEPDLVLCGEVAGPDNPYSESSPPFIERDVRLFVFDLTRQDSRRFLSGEDKIALIDRYALPAAANFGRFGTGDADPLRAILRRLDREGREGLVFKEDSPRQRRAKFTTVAANLSDIRTSVAALLDHPPEYFTSRILRLVLASDEVGCLDPPDLRARLGAAFLDGLFDAVRQQREEGRIARPFICRFHDADNARELIHFLKRAAGHVQVVPRDLRQEADFWVLEFDRVYPSLNGLLSDWLTGRPVFD